MSAMPAASCRRRFVCLKDEMTGRQAREGAKVQRSSAAEMRRSEKDKNVPTVPEKVPKRVTEGTEVRDRECRPLPACPPLPCLLGNALVRERRVYTKRAAGRKTKRERSYVERCKKKTGAVEMKETVSVVVQESVLFIEKRREKRKKKVSSERE